MKITILGCGSSVGVPVIGCDCTVCQSPNPKNNRTRSSIHIDTGKTSLLIDSSPDMRHQALRSNIRSVDAVLYTHAHADHMHGIDDLRSFNIVINKPLDIYLHQETLDEMQSRFPYVFFPPVPEYGWYRASLVPHVIALNDRLTINGEEIICFEQQHGKTFSLGFRIGDVAYSTDLNYLPESSFEALKGVKLWIVDCLRYHEAPTHAHLEMTLGWLERVKPERAILTHMAHEIEYETLKKQLPAGAEPAYDGMVIEA